MKKTFEQMLADFSNRDAECWLHSSNYTAAWTCTLKVHKDGDTLEFGGKGDSAYEALDAAYTKFNLAIERMPTYNPNLLLESSVDKSDDVPF